MSLVLATEATEVDLASMTLEQLAERANAEYELGAAALNEAVVRAIRTGEVLLEVRSRVGEEHWPTWARENLEFSATYLRRSIRYALCRERILEVGATTTKKADAAIKGEAHAVHPWTVPDDTRAEAVRLHAAGFSTREIGEVLEIHRNTVLRFVNPDFDRRQKAQQRAWQRKQYNARKALREKEAREERDRLAAERGGNIGKLYDHLRKLMPTLDAAVSEGLSVEVRALIVRAEDEIFKELKA